MGSGMIPSDREMNLARALVGAMMQYPDAVVPEVLRIIDPEGLPLVHRDLFRAIESVYQGNGHSGGVLKVEEILAACRHLNYSIPPNEITDSLDLVSTPRAAIEDARLLARLAKENAIALKAERLLSTLKESPGSPEVLDDIDDIRYDLECFGTGAGQVPKLTTLRVLLEDPDLLRPPVPVVPRFAWEGRVTLFDAREKAGKSLTASAETAAVTTGRPFLGGEVEQGNVLYLALEDHPGDVARRLKAFGADPDLVFILPAADNPLDILAPAVAQVKPRLVIVDTLPALVGNMELDPSSSSAWTPVMMRLTRIARESNAAIVLLHHATKSGTGYRDSSAIGANVDAILHMEEVGNTTSRKFSVRGRWAMDNFTITLTGSFDDNPWFELGSGGVSVDTHVLDFIRLNPGCGANTIKAGVGGSTEEKNDAKNRLLKEGLIVNRGTDKKHRYFIAGLEPVPLDETTGTNGTPHSSTNSPSVGPAGSDTGTKNPVPKGGFSPAHADPEDDDEPLPL